MPIIGFIAAILTTFSFIPQVIKVVKTKDTSGISLVMYSMFVVGVLLWAVHGYMIGDLSVLFANLVTFVLACVILSYKIRYK